MTTQIIEGELTFDFDATWCALQWDASDFRKKRGHIGKALDIVGARTGTAPGMLVAIEIKDYPAPSAAMVPSPKELAQVCVAKVRDTIAQMIHSPPLVGRPADRVTDDLCRAFGATQHELSIIVCVEDANTPPLEMLVLQDELDRQFKWLPTLAVTAATIADITQNVDGISVERA